VNRGGGARSGGRPTVCCPPHAPVTASSQRHEDPMTTKLAARAALLTTSFAALLAASTSASAQAVRIDADDIGGVVTSAKGPEGGVWVIAETRDTPTRYTKIVTTDDQGRYVLPDLPKATFD